MTPYAWIPAAAGTVVLAVALAHAMLHRDLPGTGWLDRLPAPSFPKPRARLPRRLLGRRTDRGPAPAPPSEMSPGAGPLSRLATWATLPLRLRRATGAHAAPVTAWRRPEDPWDQPAERVTHRGDTGEIDMRWDPDARFPMARPYARKAGYR